MPDPVLVAVAHGSRDPRATATVARLLTLTARRSAGRGAGLPDLRAAFLGHAPPSLPQVLASIAPGRPVRVLPLLLTAAYHAKTDIPRLLAQGPGDVPRLSISYGGTLGPHPLLLRALERRLAEADGTRDQAGPGAARGRTAVVLAAAGSSDPAANDTITAMAAAWRAEGGWLTVRPAYAATAEPSPAAAVAALRREGAPRVVVATYLLAPGQFADRIRTSSLAAGAAAVSAALGACPEVADVLLDRFAEAGAGARSRPAA